MVRFIFEEIIQFMSEKDWKWG